MYSIVGVLVVFACHVARVLSQDTHTVNVGTSGSFFDPPTLSALENDTVRFVFNGFFHGVTQSSADAPCSPLQGGFSSGLQGIMNNASLAPPIWNLKITNASAPIFYFCFATQPVSHCASGMVGVINPNSPDVYTSFLAAAKAVSGTPQPVNTVALTGIGAFATGTPSPTTTFSTVPSTTASSTSTSSTPTPTATSTTSGSKTNGAAIGGAVAGSIAIVVIGILVVFLIRARQKRIRMPSPYHIQTSEYQQSMTGPWVGGGGGSGGVNHSRGAGSLAGGLSAHDGSVGMSGGSSGVMLMSENGRPVRQIHPARSRDYMSQSGAGATTTGYDIDEEPPNTADPLIPSVRHNLDHHRGGGGSLGQRHYSPEPREPSEVSGQGEYNVQELAEKVANIIMQQSQSQSPPPQSYRRPLPQPSANAGAAVNRQESRNYGTTSPGPPMYES